MGWLWKLMASQFYHPPFVIIRDTRENTPWHFRGIFHNQKPVAVSIVDKTLTTGDYSIDGHESDIAIERKSLPDLFNCCGDDRARFQEQVRRLNDTISAPYLMVEGDWMAIEKWTGPGARPNSVIGTRISWEQKYPKVKWMFLPNPAWAQRIAFRVLDRFYTNHTGASRGKGEGGQQSLAKDQP